MWARRPARPRTSCEFMKVTLQVQGWARAGQNHMQLVPAACADPCCRAEAEHSPSALSWPGISQSKPCHPRMRPNRSPLLAAPCRCAPPAHASAGRRGAERARSRPCLPRRAGWRLLRQPRWSNKRQPAGQQAAHGWAAYAAAAPALDDRMMPTAAVDRGAGVLCRHDLPPPGVQEDGRLCWRRRGRARVLAADGGAGLAGSRAATHRSDRTGPEPRRK
jgi:hypothetical protein